MKIVIWILILLLNFSCITDNNFLQFIDDIIKEPDNLTKIMQDTNLSNDFIRNEYFEDSTYLKKFIQENFTKNGYKIEKDHYYKTFEDGAFIENRVVFIKDLKNNSELYLYFTKKHGKWILSYYDFSGSSLTPPILNLKE